MASTKLTATRGDTFVYTFTLTGATGATFTGGVKFTIRSTYPESSEVTDTAALYQGSVSGGQIAFVGAAGTLTVPASATTAWPVGSWVWDLQGSITGPPVQSYTLASGRIVVSADVTRSAP